MSAAIHKDDVGTIFQVEIRNQDNEVQDISSATIKNFIFQRPNSSTPLTVASNFATDGTDGLLRYTIVTGDLDRHGTWRLQVYLEMGSRKFSTDINMFKVEDNI